MQEHEASNEELKTKAQEYLAKVDAERQLLRALRRNAILSPDPTLIPRKEAQFTLLRTQVESDSDLQKGLGILNATALEEKPSSNSAEDTISFTKKETRLKPDLEIPKDIPRAEEVAESIYLSAMQYQLYDAIYSGQIRDIPRNSKNLIGMIYGDKNVKDPQHSFHKLLRDLRANIRTLQLKLDNIVLKPTRQDGVWIISRISDESVALQFEVTEVGTVRLAIPMMDEQELMQFLGDSDEAEDKNDIVLNDEKKAILEKLVKKFEGDTTDLYLTELEEQIVNELIDGLVDGRNIEGSVLITSLPKYQGVDLNVAKHRVYSSALPKLRIKLQNRGWDIVNPKPKSPTSEYGLRPVQTETHQNQIWNTFPSIYSAEGWQKFFEKDWNRNLD